VRAFQFGRHCPLGHAKHDDQVALPFFALDAGQEDLTSLESQLGLPV
jgi:hypothetical protein